LNEYDEWQLPEKDLAVKVTELDVYGGKVCYNTGRAQNRNIR